MDHPCPSRDRATRAASRVAGSAHKSQTGCLFRKFREEHDLAARERLVHRYMPLARRLARRYETAESREDVRQVAYLGLVKAIHGFDPARGTSFTSYAIPTIAGEIKRHLRDYGWDVHVSRGLKESVLRVRRETDRLTREHGRAPSVDELAMALRLTPDAVIEVLMAAEAYAARSLDAPIPPEASAMTRKREAIRELGAADDGFQRVVDRDSLRLALATLPERQRQMIGLHFFAGLTQSKVAARLGVSQMQVSRVLRQAIGDMSRSDSVCAPPCVTGDAVGHHSVAGPALTETSR